MKFSKKLIVFILLACFSFSFVFLIAGHSTRLTQSSHGLLHSSYVYQILNGIIPPSNPLSIGMPVNNYWAWHALLAAIVKVFRITPFEASLFVNATALTITLSLMWFLIGNITKKIWTRAIFIFMPTFILNPLGLFRYIYIVAANNTDFSNLSPHPKYFTPIASLFGVGLDPRASTLLGKNLNFTGFSVGIAVFILFLALINNNKGKSLRSFLYFFIASTVVFFIHPTTAIAIAIIIGAFMMFLCHDYLKYGGDRKSVIRRSLIPVVGFSLGAAIASPYILATSKAFGEPITLNLGLKPLLGNVISIGWVIVPQIIIYYIAILKFWTNNTFIRLNVFLGASLAISCILLEIPGSNEYKIAMLSSIPASLVLLSIFREFYTISIKKYDIYNYFSILGKLFLSFVSALIIWTYASVYLHSKWANENPYLYNGRNIELNYPNDNITYSQLNEAYLWLRRNTNPEVYILEYPVYMNNLELSVISQRRTVVAEGFFTKGIPHHPILVKTAKEIISKLSTFQITSSDLDRLFSINVPWPEKIYAFVRWQGINVLDIGSEGKYILPEGALLIFKNDKYGIFQINCRKIQLF